MARYGKDCLPKNQETFARTLGQANTTHHSRKINTTFPETSRVEGPVRTSRVNHRGFHRSTQGSNRVFSPAAEFLLKTEELVKRKLTKPEQNDVGNNRHSNNSIGKRTQLRECRQSLPKKSSQGSVFKFAWYPMVHNNIGHKFEMGIASQCFFFS